MVGIIGAMDGEVQGLKDSMQDVTIVQNFGMNFYRGKLFGKDTVVVQSGIGKVNASVCATLLIDSFGVDKLINTGIAGSLNNDINIGDVVLSTDAVQHDVDATAFGKYAYGEIPAMGTVSFKADETLLNTAEQSCKKVNTDIKVFRGRVVSGDQFISDKAKKQWLIDTFGGYCTEMEGASIAQVAYLSGVPFLIVRVISDKADDSTTVDYPEFEKKAIERSIRLVKEVIKNI